MGVRAGGSCASLGGDPDRLSSEVAIGQRDDRGERHSEQQSR